MNRRRITDALRRSGPLSQAEVARATGLSESTVFNLVTELVESNLAEVGTGLRNGRRANLVSLTERGSGVLIGVAVNRSTIQVAVVRAGGEQQALHEAERTAGESYEVERGRIERMVGDAITDSGAARDSILGLGVGICVSVDPVIGRIPAYFRLTPDVLDQSWAGADIGGDLERGLGLPVSVWNDGDCGAAAESRWGAGRGRRDQLYLDLSCGVGAGLVLGGRPYRGGEGGFAGEVGHISADANGRLCECGNRGCLATFLNRSQLLEQLEGIHGPGLSMERFAIMAGQGDPACCRVLRDLAHPLAIVLSGVIALVTPEVVILGGILAAAGDVLQSAVRDALQGAGPGGSWRGSVLLAEYGRDAVVVGAASAVLTELEAAFMS